MNKVLKIFKFWLPETTPEGEVFDDVFDELEAKLYESFGSFTVSTCEQFTRNEKSGDLEHDDCLLYSVLCEDLMLNRQKILSIVKEACGELGLSSFTYQTPEGEVFFVSV